MTMTRTSEFTITPSDLQNLLRGEGGVDLERVTEPGAPPSMRVVGVKPGTTAARLGAENGDTIESINDRPLVSVAAAYQAADLAVKEARIVIKGRRGGEPYVTTLTLR